jgi:hypothetical protein
MLSSQVFILVRRAALFLHQESWQRKVDLRELGIYMRMLVLRLQDVVNIWSGTTTIRIEYNKEWRQTELEKELKKPALDMCSEFLKNEENASPFRLSVLLKRLQNLCKVYDN